jgi:hypothetical protein
VHLLHHDNAHSASSPTEASMPNSQPVDLVCTGGAIPFMASGHALFADGAWTVHLDREVGHLNPGTAAILSFTDPDQPRIIGQVVEASGNRLLVAEKHKREREKRAYPRLVGGVPLRYRLLHRTEERAETLAWLSGDKSPLNRGEWITPDDLMNFSVTGLRFESDAEAEAGQVLLLDLGVRGHGSWRCTARVVRTFDAPPDGVPNGSRSLAVSFEVIPTEAEEALTEMTLAIQDAML